MRVRCDRESESESDGGSMGGRTFTHVGKLHPRDTGSCLKWDTNPTLDPHPHTLSYRRPYSPFEKEMWTRAKRYPWGELSVLESVEAIVGCCVGAWGKRGDKG